MSVRKRALNAGWYPKNPEEVKKTLEGWNKDISLMNGIASVVPHAGWYFSGKLAFRTLGALRRDIDLMVILGGHLGADSSLLIAEEDEFEVPGGTIRNEFSLVGAIKKSFKTSEDWDVDNGVEVQLPIIRYFWPETSLVSLRVPPSLLAVELGEMLFHWSLDSGKTVGVIGSTDLTHYGPNYGFSPHGNGKKAVEWVEKENDAEIIRQLINMNHGKALNHAMTQRSACSIGAAITSMSFARSAGVRKGVLTGYLNSYHVQPGASFVGYAGVVYA